MVPPEDIERHKEPRNELSGGFTLYNTSLVPILPEVSSSNDPLITTLVESVNLADVTNMKLKPVYTHQYLHDGYFGLNFPFKRFTAKHPRIFKPIPVLQYWYDSIFPDDLGCSNADDPYIADNSELTLHSPDMSIVTLPKRMFPDNYDCMEPELKTHISAPRRQNMTEVLLALYKRNYNVPELRGLCYEQDVVEKSVGKFLESTYLRINRKH